MSTQKHFPKLPVLAMSSNGDPVDSVLEHGLGVGQLHVGRRRVRVDLAEGHHAARDLDAVARAEHVRDDPSAIYGTIGQSLLRRAEDRAMEADLPTVAHHLEFGDAAAGIIDYARKHAIDTIVMGTRGLGELQGLLMGSVSMKVQSLAPCTCICVR